MIWLTGGYIYDMSSRSFDAGSLAIADGRIVASTPGRPPVGAATIDLTDHYLLPGLIDSHVHLTMRTDTADPYELARRSEAQVAVDCATAARRTLLAGVTTVRDLGGWDYAEMAVRQAGQRGELATPRMFLAGRLLSVPTGGAEYYPGMYEVCEGVSGIVAGAERQFARGADVIKVMATGAMLSPESEDFQETQFTREDLSAAVAAAAARSSHVAAHAHAKEGIRNAVIAGAASIEHGTFADEDVLSLMATRGTYLVPTLCVTSAMMREPGIRDAMTDHERARLVDNDDQHVRAVALAHRMGVPISMGTDAGTPGNHHGDNTQEIVEMVNRAGFSPAAAIAASTINPAALLGLAEHLGSLDVGKCADVIAVARNPLDDITALQDVAFVMKDGAVHKHPAVG